MQIYSSIKLKYNRTIKNNLEIAVKKFGGYFDFLYLCNRN